MGSEMCIRDRPSSARASLTRVTCHPIPRSLFCLYFTCYYHPQPIHTITHSSHSPSSLRTTTLAIFILLLTTIFYSSSTLQIVVLYIILVIYNGCERRAPGCKGFALCSTKLVAWNDLSLCTLAKPLVPLHMWGGKKLCRLALCAIIIL